VSGQVERLAAALADRSERFVVEIKTTAALQHPHILPLFDSGTAVEAVSSRGFASIHDRTGGLVVHARALVTLGIEARESFLSFATCPAWGPFRADSKSLALREGVGP